MLAKTTSSISDAMRDPQRLIYVCVLKEIRAATENYLNLQQQGISISQ